MLGDAIRRIAAAARRKNTASDVNVAVAANLGEPGSVRTSVRRRRTRIVQRDGVTRTETHVTDNERGT